MTENQKRLNPPNDIPRLSEAEVRERIVKQGKKINRWYRIYLATTLGVLILTALLLVVGLSESKLASESSRFEDLASSLIYGDFMDLSGSSAPYNKNEIPGGGIFEVINGILIPSGDEDDSGSIVVPGENKPSKDGSIYDFDYSKVPEGETAIIPMDLSLSSEGSTYIYNSTGYSPDTSALLASSFKPQNGPVYISSSAAPQVLIVHTHGTESYSADGAISFLDRGGEIARSEDTSKNVVAVGAVLSEALNRGGVPTIHCTVMHDRLQYKDSYARAEETIKQYLEKYPSIKLVIDLHRDAVIKSTGELVRAVSEVDKKAVAQVMCVVGSDWGGQSCPSWQNNLALALKLRDSLNKKYGNLCRPTYLRSSTYNQELAPFSLLLEVGSCGNSLEEAKRAVSLVAEELIPLIKTM